MRCVEEIVKKPKFSTNPSKRIGFVIFFPIYKYNITLFERVLSIFL